MTAAPLTAALAGSLAALAAGDLPAPIAARTLAVVLDGSGCLLAAANPAWSTGRLIGGFAEGQGGVPEASLVGQGFRTGAVHAALANGTPGYACQFEPHHPAAILHPVAVRLEVGDRFEERRASDPLARALAARVRVGQDDGALAARFPEAHASELVLRTEAGEGLPRRNDVARGYAGTPLSRAEVEAKFAALVGNAERAAAPAHRIAELPEATDSESYALALEAPLAGGQES